ncbi:MAG TPA: hypothetical protein VGF45_05995, partial [Polyangia bacterium]
MSVAVLAGACVGTIGGESGEGTPGGASSPGAGMAGGGPSTGSPSTGNGVVGGGNGGVGNGATGSPDPGGGGLPPPAPGFACSAPMSFGYRTVRLLTREQYQNSV